MDTLNFTQTKPTTRNIVRFAITRLEPMISSTAMKQSKKNPKSQKPKAWVKFSIKSPRYHQLSCCLPVSTNGKKLYRSLNYPRWSFVERTIATAGMFWLNKLAGVKVHNTITGTKLWFQNHKSTTNTQQWLQRDTNISSWEMKPFMLRNPIAKVYGKHRVCLTNTHQNSSLWAVALEFYSPFLDEG